MEDEKTKMIISYSEVVKWQTCQRSYYYNFVLGRRPTEETSALSTGIKGHALLQSFYEFLHQGHSKEEALKLTEKEAMKIINSSHKFKDLDLLLAWTLVANYIRETDFTSEAFFIENRFIIPASHLTEDDEVAGIEIGFTPDVVFQRKGKHLDIEDAKFVGRAWSKNKLNRFPQLKLYQAFLEGMGYNVSRTVLRFFNTQTGKISTQTYTMTEVEKEILIRDFMSAIKEVYAFKHKTKAEIEKAPRTMNYNVCQFCSYNFVCSLQAQGKDATRTLETQYVESKYAYTR